MPIVASDIKYRLSGGASNSDPTLSLGGAKSSNDASTTFFDDVQSAEALAGDIEYRCFYIHNAHATLTMLGTRIWIQTQTPSADTDAAIGLGASAIGGTESSIANENTAPAGVTFSQPSSYGGGLVIGDIPPGSSKAVWVRRTVNAGAAAASDNFTIRTQCDTNP